MRGRDPLSSRDLGSRATTCSDLSSLRLVASSSPYLGLQTPKTFKVVLLHRCDLLFSCASAYLLKSAYPRARGK